MAEVIAPGVWWLHGTRGSNVFLAESDGALVLIDSGFGASLDAIVAEVERATPGRAPTHLLLTHAHPDHAGSAAGLRGRYGLAIVAGAGDCDIDAGGRATLRRLSGRPRPGRGTIVRVVRMARRLTRGSPAGTASARRESGRAHDVPVDIVISSETHAAGLRCVPTPGHTPGSVCYVLEDRGVAFVGDLVISHRDGLARPLHFINHDDRQYLATLSEFAKRAPAIGLAGHGPPVLGDFGEQLRMLASQPRRRLLSAGAALQRVRRLRDFARNVSAERR